MTLCNYSNVPNFQKNIQLTQEVMQNNYFLLCLEEIYYEFILTLIVHYVSIKKGRLGVP